ncbi:protease Do-like 8, chloroplastic isoform X3 [Musa acuminata AAA Group]|uniref:protease Do-like 8, chloroplastic isoform X3 n=1 Tax=Musa acuminata AAA Group TaxID=214697 RepID=UPI0031CFAFED
MLVLACSRPLHSFRPPRCFGRRELFIDGVSSISSQRPTAPAPHLHLAASSRSSSDEQTFNLGDTMKTVFPFTSRRMLFAGSTLWFCLHTSKYFPAALALEEPSITTEDVTPRVFLSGPLFPSEERTVEIFEKNTYSVVNIFDVTLRPRLNATGVVEVPEGNGSGVVWDKFGHIVTNYHVVGNALSKNPNPDQVVARVNILVAEGVQKTFEGRLIGANRAKDLAVLKVDASADLLKPINVGQSSVLRVGQQCLAIGNPFGFDHTLTVGVISGLNRDIVSKTGVTIGGGIQTDAAINPGNSGGPLLDSKGNMIGINTAIFTNTGASAGVGFAIPSSTVLRIVPQLIQFGKIPENSVAAKAGLLPTTRGLAGNIVLGDVIVAVDNKPVRSKADLLKILDEYNVGNTVLLKIQRGSENLDLPVVLEETSI